MTSAICFPRKGDRDVLETKVPSVSSLIGLLQPLLLTPFIQKTPKTVRYVLQNHPYLIYFPAF